MNTEINRKPNKNEKVIKLSIPNNISESVKKDIISILSGMKFSKISIPLTTLRKYFDSKFEGTTKLTNVGYIRRFNSETNEFTIVIFNSKETIDAVNKIKEPKMYLKFSTYNDRLGTIIKFIVDDTYETDVKE